MWAKSKAYSGQKMMNKEKVGTDLNATIDGCRYNKLSMYMLPGISGEGFVDPNHGAPAPPPPPPKPSLPEGDDVLWEVLLRLPPLPFSLPRASLVCKRWHRLVTDPSFLRRFSAHHRHTPPLLGFFQRSTGSFFPALGPSDRISAARFSIPLQSDADYACALLDCRRGLALLLDHSRHEAVLWNPVTGDQHRVPVPMKISNSSSITLHGALLPAAGDGHDHCSSPFRLVFLCRESWNFARLRAYLYQSESGWCDLILTAVPVPAIPNYKQGVLAGNVLYWALHGGHILMFDLDAQNLSVIDEPSNISITGWYTTHISRTKDQGLGLAVLSRTSMQLWELCERKADSSKDVTRIHQKTVELDKLLRLESSLGNAWPAIRGYDEDGNAILLWCDAGVFYIQLKSLHFKKVSGSTSTLNTCYPYSSIFTAGANSSLLSFARV